MSNIYSKRAIRSIDQLKYIYKNVQEIIESLDEYALDEIYSGSGRDIDRMIDIITEETDRILFENAEKVRTPTFSYLDKLTESIDESLRKLNITYFITSVLPDFEINWHHIEWGNFVHLYNYLCCIASRDSGKSYFFSHAYLIWKMYRYEKLIGRKQTEFSLSKLGMLITNEQTLVHFLLSIIKETIEENDILRNKLFPGKGEGWGGGSIICKNGAKLITRSYGSRMRGFHPGYVVVDDFLTDNVLYSQDQRDKYKNIFYGVVDNMLIRGGQIIVAGCVVGDTYVNTENGLVKIIDICPIEDKINNKTIPFKLKIDSLNGIDETSHYHINGLTDTKIITTDYGFELECSVIHPLQHMTKDGNIIWKQSKDLNIDDYIAIKIGGGFHGDKINISGFEQNKRGNQILNLGEYVDNDLAYFIGIWIGDGSICNTGRLNITKSDPFIVNFLYQNKWGLKFDNTSSNKLTHRVQNKNFYNLLKYIGLDYNTALYKKIPDSIISSDQETIKSLLQGLFDTDGSISYINNVISITLGSISKVLIKQVHQLLLLFGIVGGVHKQKPGISKKVIGKHPCWIIVIYGLGAKLFLDKIGFTTPLKQKDINYNNIRFVGHDYIPHQKYNIKRARLTKPRIKRNTNKKYFVSSQGLLREKISFKNLLLFCDWIDEFGGNTDIIRNNIQKDILWVKIKNIIESKNYTYDFVIPNSHCFISNGFISHNTPFLDGDLYSTLKKDKRFRVFEYPAIYPDGKLLWPSRHPMSELLAKKEAVGQIIFSREQLVKSITDGASIFPYDVIKRAYIGMDSYVLVNNIQSFPQRFDCVVCGTDFAFSAETGADDTVFTVVGGLGNDYWLIYMFVGHGMEYDQQMATLKQININFNPDLFVIETNQAQKIFYQMARDAGLPVMEHQTGVEKYKLDEGLPGMAVIFERGNMKIPRGNQESIDLTDQLAVQLNSFTFDPDRKKLISLSTHDDMGMSLWQACRGVRYVRTGFQFSFI